MFKKISAKNKLASLCKMLGLCLMSMCVCVSSIFCMPKSNVSAATMGASNPVSLIAGSKVYFGEYPQDAVIKVNSWTSSELIWTSGDTEQKATITKPLDVDVDSINVHTAIKGKIEDLLKDYYSTSHTLSNGETTPVITSYNWHDTTYGYFAPKEDYSNDEISYDDSTGYYTLLKPVSSGNVSYSAGTKFHAYNRFVDSVNKLYKVDVGNLGRNYDGKTIKNKTVYLTSFTFDEYNHLTTGLNPNEASIKHFGSREYLKDSSKSYLLSRNEFMQPFDDSNIYYDQNEVVTMHGYDKWVDSAAKDEDFDITGTGMDGIFLFEVKPIEWTVVTPENLTVTGGSGNYVTLVSSQIIDSNSFNYYASKITSNTSLSYGTSYDSGSILKGWLNGYETSTVNASPTKEVGAEDVFYHSNRTFMDLAFSNAENDLQEFQHTSSAAAKVGLMNWKEVTDNKLAACYKTQFAAANGDQGALGKYRWLLDDSVNFAVYRDSSDPTNVIWETYYGSALEYGLLGVRPMICVDLSTFGAAEKVGDIAAGETLNISSPLSLGGEVDVTGTSYTTPNLLHVKTENVVSGKLVVSQKGDVTEENYIEKYDVSATDIAVSVGGKSVPALSGFVVAGIRIYQTDSTHNIMTNPTYDVKFVPVTSFLGASGETNNVITNLSGQFVMTFYLVWRGNVYLIPAECVTNPTIYATTGTSKTEYCTNSGRTPDTPVNVEIAKRLAGNDMDVDVGHMSTLSFAAQVGLSSNAYQFDFKYPVVFHNDYGVSDDGYAFSVSQDAGEITFKNITFDGQNFTYKKGLILVGDNASAKFEDCVIKNVVTNSSSDGSALVIANNATVTATTLEVSNCSAKNGGGIVCKGTLSVKNELILTNNTAAENGGGMFVSGNVEVATLTAKGNFAQNGSSIYAATTGTQNFNVTGSLNIEGDKGIDSESGKVYPNSVAYFSSYSVTIAHPNFIGNETFFTPLYFEECNATINGTDAEKGLFKNNISYGENGAAAICIKEDGSARKCLLQWINFEGNSSSVGGFGAVKIMGKYRSDDYGVTIDNCDFSGNDGYYSGALSIVKESDGSELSGKIKISNTDFAQNKATSTIADDMAGALLVSKQKSNSQNPESTSQNSLVLELNKLTFVGNVSTKYGVAKLLLEANDNVSLSNITLGGELLDGNSLDSVRNVSTTAGALFAIIGKTKKDETTTISIQNFVARNNIKNNIATTDAFANAGVLLLDNVKNADNVLINNSQFVKNDGTSSGGAVIIKDSSGNIENSYFEGNKISVAGKTAVGGGAVYLSGTTSTQNVNIISSTFLGNSAAAVDIGGGAVLANNVVLTLTDVHASGNAATGGSISKGGAICSYGHAIDNVEYITKCQHVTPTLTISGGYFEGNQAKGSTSQGGAVWAECVQIVSGGENAGMDKNAWTGFVGQSEYTQKETSGQAKFVGNKTLKTNGTSSGEGGAIYTATCFEISNENGENIVAYFEGNTAQNGGAVRAKGVATIDGAQFEGNTAQSDEVIGYGGAISFGNSEKTIMFSNYLQNSTTTQGPTYALPMFAKIVLATFTENTANYGGAVYSDSAIGYNDEQVFAKYSSLQIVGKNANAVKFSSNEAKENEKVASAHGTGGAVYAVSPVVFDGIVFERNTADFCSAIYWNNNCQTFDKASKSYVPSDKFGINNATFAENESQGSGIVGAGKYAHVTIKNSNFDGNTNGGAVLQFSKIEGALGDGTIENCIFLNNKNTAESYGGDVVSVTGREVAINNCTFGQNGDTTKSNFGTAIMIENGGMVYLNNVSAKGEDGINITHTMGFVRVNAGGNLKVVGGEMAYLKNTKTSTSSANEIAGGGAVVVLGNASFDGINISNCTATNGGAIYVANGGSLSFAGVISNCQATTNGGGIYVESGAFAQIAGKLKLDMTYSQSLINGCSATNGGGVFVAGELLVAHATISNNLSSEEKQGNGAGIYAKDGSSLTLQKGAIISGNLLRFAGSYGGGVFVEGYLSLQGAEISNNGFEGEIENCLGGGLFASNVTFDATDVTFASNKAANGGGAYVTNSVVNWTNCVFNSNSATNGGALYLDNCQANMLGCSFWSNAATGQGRAALINSGNVVAQNSTFEDKELPSEQSVAKLYVTACRTVEIIGCDFAEKISIDEKDRKGKISHAKIEATDSVEIIDCNFILGYCAGDESSVEISAPNVWVEDCMFDKNADGGLSLKANYGIVANSQFLSNKKNGGLKLAPLGEGVSSVEIIDTTFTKAEGSDSGNVSAANGGAIYVSSKVNLRLSGNVEVTQNESASGGAIYVQDGGKIVITRGSKVVIAGNKHDDAASNLLFASSNDTTFLEGGLLEGSSIGLSLTTGTEIASSPNDLPLESADINKLFCDDSSKILSYSQSDKTVYCYARNDSKGKIVSEEVGGETYSITLSDISLLYSNMQQDGYVIDKSYFKVTNDGGNAIGINSISFSVQAPGESDFSEEQDDSVTISQKGNYVVKVIIKNVGENVDLPNLQGEINVDILGEYLYIISTPKAIMTSNKASSFRIVQAGSVVRSNGQEVAGTWGLISPENVTKSGYYACKFVPKQTSLYENRENVLGTMFVDVVYDKLYYRGENEIYADSEGSVKVNAETLSDAINLLADNGTIVFANTYVVNTRKTLTLSKKVNFVREKSTTDFAMIEVQTGGSLDIVCSSGGTIFEGQNDNTNYPIFVIEGELVLGAGVVVRNFSISQPNGSDVRGVICNNGTLVLNGCTISNNTLNFVSSELSSIGGVVYNKGTMEVLGGKFEGNKATNSNGGFVYNAGKLTVSGGNITNNTSGSGAGVYVANGGSAVLAGGVISHNYAQNKGGGVFVASGGKVSLLGSQILSNMALSPGAGLFNNDGGIVVLSNGEEVLTSTIESVERLNEPVQAVCGTTGTNWIVIVCGVLMALATGIFVFVMIKFKSKSPNGKK